MTVEIVTFGCRLNAFESEAIRGIAHAAGLDNAVIVNTCAVTSEAERQARQAIRRARREHPSARVIVTGCAAQIAPERYAAMAEVDQVVGNREKFSPAIYAAGAPRTAVGSREAMRDAVAPAVEGCDGKVRTISPCSMAATIPAPSASSPKGAAPPARCRWARSCARRARASPRLSRAGADRRRYRLLRARPAGEPEPRPTVPPAAGLVPELARLRLSSLDPAAIDDELWRLLAEEERLMPHLHLSLQAGSDMVLKRMKRRHLRADALALCRRARELRPGLALGADLIAGFPTEDEAMFAETQAFVAEAPLDYLHVFPYSAGPARLPRACRKCRGAWACARGAMRAAGEDAMAPSACRARRIGRASPGRAAGFRAQQALRAGSISRRIRAGRDRIRAHRRERARPPHRRAGMKGGGWLARLKSGLSRARSASAKGSRRSSAEGGSTRRRSTSSRSS